jgi:hypothetical protein
MKDEKLNKGIQGLKQPALGTTEKSAMLSRLHAYADYHKMKPAAPVASSWIHFFSVHRYSYGTLAILIVLSTSSVSFAAEKALPGDILYPIKVNINESVRSAFTVNPEAKAKWESDKIFRRVEEAETLAAQGKFDEASLLEVENLIDAHFENFTALSSKTNTKSEASAKSAAPALDTARSFEAQPQTMMLAVPAEESSTGASANASLQIETKTAPRKGSFNAKIEEHKTIIQNIKSASTTEQNARLEKLQRKLEEKSEEGLSKGLELSIQEDTSALEAAVIQSQKNGKNKDKNLEKTRGKNK